MEIIIDWKAVGEYLIFAAALLTALGVIYQKLVLPKLTRDIKNAVASTVNGGLKHVEHKVEEAAARVDRRFDRHEQRHNYERAQLVAALERSNISPPDGWRDFRERKERK